MKKYQKSGEGNASPNSVKTYIEFVRFDLDAAVASDGFVEGESRYRNQDVITFISQGFR
jgi:hypothetical protein